MFHKPRWSSAGGLTHMQQLWQDLYDGGADIVLGGHLHNYERFAPMAGTAPQIQRSGCESSWWVPVEPP